MQRCKFDATYPADTFDSDRGPMDQISTALSTSTDEIAKCASDYAFGRPLVSNNFRVIIFEAILRTTLSVEWNWCSHDWGPWDFQHRDGARLEVKQSTARQSWKTTQPARPTFDIKPRTGHYDGTKWVKSIAPERFAGHIHVWVPSTGRCRR